MAPHPRPARRRERSGRVLAAVLLVLAAGLLVGLAASGDSLATLRGAAVLAVALAVAAVRVSYLEVADTRRDAEADRAAQAQAYRELSSTRRAEQEAHRLRVERRARQQREQAAELTGRLGSAQARASRAESDLVRARERAEELVAEQGRLRHRLAQTERAAAAAHARLAEVELERDALAEVAVPWPVERSAERSRHSRHEGGPARPQWRRRA